MSFTIHQQSGLALFPLVNISPLPQGDAGSVVSGEFFDVEIDTTTLSASWNDYLFNLSESLGSDALMVDNLTPEICDTTGFPLVERVSPGLASIRLTFGEVKSTRTLNMMTIGGSSSVAATGYVSGSVGAHSYAIIEPLLAAGGDLNLLSGGTGVNFSAATYNAGCWAADFDFSGVCHFNNSSNSATYAGTLLRDGTRRHVIMASHWLPPVGTALTMIAPDGTKHTRTILAYNSGNTFNGKINQATFDIAVAVMSSAYPETIEDYPVVGEWIKTDTVDSFGRVAYAEGWLGVKLNQQRQALIAGRSDTLVSQAYFNSSTYAGVTFDQAFTGHFTDWGPDVYLPPFLSAYSAKYTYGIEGDSGSPAFFPLTSSTLALAGCIMSSSGFSTYPDPVVVGACISSADSNAGIVTGYSLVVTPDPTL